MKHTWPICSGRRVEIFPTLSNFAHNIIRHTLQGHHPGKGKNLGTVQGCDPGRASESRPVQGCETLAGLRRVTLHRPCTGLGNIWGCGNIRRKVLEKNWFFFSRVFFISSLLSGVDAILLEVMLSYWINNDCQRFFFYWRIKKMFLV